MSASNNTSALATLSLLLLMSLFGTAHGIRCYRCISTNSSRPFLCNEFTTDNSMETESCDDVYDAKYCVKQVGRFEVLTLDCYQCTSANEWMCEGSDLVTQHLQPKNCDHVFEAQYCIKTVGRYGGGIGTKRFCSSENLGNRCDNVRQPGDSLLYRTCIYTCQSDGCNPAALTTTSRLTNILPLLTVTFVSFGFFSNL